MKTLIYCKAADQLNAFAAGHREASAAWDHYPGYDTGYDTRGFWLLIDEVRDGDNQTYELTALGLAHTDTGVEI